MSYTKTTFVNGTAPAINAPNLNNNEDGTEFAFNAIANSFSAGINAYFGNTKLGDDFQDDSAWTSVLGTQSADTTNVKIGSQSLKILENDNVAGALISHLNGISLDFNILNNGEVSDDNDYILIPIFVSDVSFINAVSVLLDQDTPFGGTDFKSISISAGSLVTGWNFLKIKKSDFSTNGSGSFSGIQSIRIRWDSLINAQNEFVSFQLIQLVKKDPLSLIPNPFQRFGVRDFAINSGEWFVGEEFGSIAWKELSGVSSDSDALINDKPYNDFIVTGEIITNESSTSIFAVGWQIDTLNKIECQIAGDILRMRTVEVGSATSFDTPFPIDVNDSLNFKLEKSGSDIILTAIKNNDLSTLTQIVATTILTDDGFLAIGRRTGVQTYKSASITEISHAHHSDISEVAKTALVSEGLSKYVTTSINGDTITVNDTLTTERSLFQISTDVSGTPIQIIRNGHLPKDLLNPDGTDVEELLADDKFFEVVEDAVNFSLAPKGGVKIKSLQRFVKTMVSDDSDFVTISAVDVDNTVVTVSTFTNSDNTQNTILTAELVNSTTVQLVKGAASGTVESQVTVTEFTKLKSKQTGTANSANGDATTDVTITAVDVDNFMLFWSVRTNNADEPMTQWFSTAQVLSTTLLRFEANTSGAASDLTYKWQVIEF